MKTNNYYVIPKARSDAFRSLLSSMQMAINEVFEEDYLPAKIGPAVMEYQMAFHEAARDITLERLAPQDLDEIF
jgi:hypothetical protein